MIIIIIIITVIIIIALYSNKLELVQQSRKLMDYLKLYIQIYSIYKIYIKHIYIYIYIYI